MTTSFYIPGKSILQNAHKCVHCAGLIEAGAKFCGQCGVLNSFSNDVLQAHAQTSQPAIAQASSSASAVVDTAASTMRRAQTETTSHERMQMGGQLPAFARAHYQQASPKLQKELGQIMTALLREKTILLVNSLVFVCVSLFGFTLSLKCYTEFNGDDVAKFMMAFTPFLFVNVVGCVALIPVRGAKREIYRLNEKLKVLKSTMDYGHLMK